MMGKMYAPPKQNDKFLWVRFTSLGDVLQALSAAFLIKQKFPDISMSFLTTPLFVDIVRSQPYIDDVICGEKKPLSVLLKTAEQIKNKKYDYVASTFKGAHMALMAYMSKIPCRLGSSKHFSFLETANVYDWARSFGIDLHERSTPSIFTTVGYSAIAKELVAPMAGKKKMFTVIGASSESKMWPLDNWEAFIRPLADVGWGFVINGYGHRELDFAEALQRRLPGVAMVNLVGKLDYLEMAAVARECDAAVGNDTGPLHLAALSGVPTVGVFDYLPPIEVGYTMPNFACVAARNEPLQTFYAKRRSQTLLAEIPADRVLEKLMGIYKPSMLNES